MPVFSIRFIAANPERELIQKFAGCVDEHDARKKLREVFDVVVIKKVERVLDT